MIDFKVGDEVVLQNAALWNQHKIYEIEQIREDGTVVLTHNGFHYSYDTPTFYWMKPRLAGEFD